MSAHFSKFMLNTYYHTPYFEAYTPKDYPLSSVLCKSRAFRRLPPNLRKLAALSKEAARRATTYGAEPPSIGQWYDEDGYELNPYTGERLTDEEIDAEWDRAGPNLELDKFKVKDIPIPDGGFADPETWKEPPSEPEEDEPEFAMTEDKLLSAIKSHGRDYVARYYGVPKDQLTNTKDDRGLAQVILNKLKKPQIALEKE